MIDEKLRNDLISRVREVSLLRGDFTLRSGKKSKFYLDVKRAYGDPGLLNSLADALYLDMDCDKKATCVAGYGYGGRPLADVISSRHGLNLIQIRDEPKGHGTQKLIEGYEPDQSDKIIIPDDVFTSGGSLRKATEILLPMGVEIIKYGVVVNREEGHPDTLPAGLVWLMTAKEVIGDIITL